MAFPEGYRALQERMADIRALGDAGRLPPAWSPVIRQLQVRDGRLLARMVELTILEPVDPAQQAEYRACLEELDLEAGRAVEVWAWMARHWVSV